MSAYTRSLALIADIPAAVWYEIYRAPDVGTVVLRDIAITNWSGVEIASFGARLRPKTRAGEVWFLSFRPLGTTTVHLDLRQVIPPGWSIEASASTAMVSLALTGYVFTD